MNDKWKYLREGLFRAVEPVVELVAITRPVGKYGGVCNSETLPAFTARASHESKGTPDDDVRLNQTLIKLGHDTPLQAVNYVFFVSGVSKALQAQWTRHKIGVGWTFRSTRYVTADKNYFVYATYDYLNSEERVRLLLTKDEKIAITAISTYEEKRKLGASKEDARKIMPVQFATSCYYYTNARAMRHLFELRLHRAAEWEIRRLACMFYDICAEWTHSLYSDLAPLRAKAWGGEQ